MASQIDIRIGAAIRRRREGLRLGLAELGRAIGVSAETMRDIETGEGHVDDGKLFVLSGALDLSLPEIWADSEIGRQSPATPTTPTGAG